MMQIVCEFISNANGIVIFLKQFNGTNQLVNSGQRKFGFTVRRAKINVWEFERLRAVRN